ncbi:MAG: patatin-like phospholipase family protein [Burkholderiales bacterium]|nr:patatin-like phospholipase family protein [Burkholderiales bacterium]
MSAARSSLLAGLIFALLVGPHAALAVDAPPPRAPGTPPRIGLALSGGGARGIAHVGVLKVLEEMRIPISCVTGTSMGAIVGGTFAVGTPPKRLEELVLAADWPEIFRDNPPRQELAIRRKADDYKTLFAPEFGVKDGGLALPKGIIAGVSIEAFFRVLAEPAIGIADFSKLPIPFEAMATDIENGQSVVLNRGSVAQAMRASMSVPGAIAPVEIDGRLLVDGGIANNLPIDQARKLCADVVIAVNISTPPLKRDELNSALAVSLQLVNFLGMQTVNDQLKRMGPDDVLIEPDLGTISAASFGRSRDAIRIGEEATRKLAASLSRYSMPPEQFAQFRSRQIAKNADLGTVAEIRFEGLERTNPEVLRGMLETKPGEPLTEQKINADLRRIYGRGDFEGISYRIVGDAGPRTMVITPREKLWGPDYLRFGLGLASDFQGNNQFNVLVQYRKTWLNSLGAEWLTEAQIGQDTHLFSEFYQPLNEAGFWFGSLYGAVGQTSRGFFEDDDQVATYLIGSARAGVDLGATLGTWGSLRLGPQWTQVNARVDVGDPILPSVNELTAGGRVQLVVDQLDHPWFPQHGYAANLNYYGATTALGSALDYQRLQASGSFVRSWGPHSFSIYAAGGTDFGSSMPAYETFALGGPLRLSGFKLNQFSGREYVFGRAMYYHRIVALPDLLGSGVYAGASAEVGNIRDRVDGLPAPGTLYSGSVFLGAETFAGPGYLGLGFGNGGAFSVYLLLGAP